MNDIIFVKPEKCVGCNACVRSCPAPEANITKMFEDGRFVTSVNSDKCVACGQCLKACTHGARDYIDDTRVCLQRLEKDKTIILVSPAIRTALPNHWVSVLDWFKSKGCAIFDIGFGADICTWAHLKIMDEESRIKFISQQCPAVVKYIETYQPNIIRNLSPIHSPVGCTVAYIKKYLKRTNPVAVLTPCIAQKNEFAETGLVEYTITFNKLMEYFDANGIVIHTNADDIYEYKFDDQQGQLGSVYIRPNGFKDNLMLHEPELNVFNSEGVEKAYEDINIYADTKESLRPEIMDVLSCEYGCSIGPGADRSSSPFSIMTKIRNIERDAKKRRKTSVFRQTEDKLFKKFDEELVLEDFKRSYTSQSPSPLPSETQLDTVFKMMGKTSDADKCYDCRACGYNSCRELATAVCRGINTPSSCIVNQKKLLGEQEKMYTTYQEKCEEITGRCRDIVESLQEKVEGINTNVATIDDSANKTKEKAKVLNDLLSNIIIFCKNNENLDKEGINQMIVILETTHDSLKSLDENIDTTNSSSELITKSLNEVKESIENINKTLNETIDIDTSK
ncbi:MAG: 4Fe-4S binding protein [Ruminococcus sp.]|nr:4Fe-4S binding protein [Ruminococcus sp.]